jgi:hypothetical protein
VPAYLLYDAWCAFGSAEQSQKSAMERLKALYGQKPFPAESNIQIEQANIASVEGWRKDLLKRLSAGGVVKVHKTPGTFKTYLSDVRKQLVQLTIRSGVAIPEGFAFGFATYANSELLPDSKDDLPSRLAEQLAIIEYICKILIDEKIYELNAVQRDELEAARVVPSGPPPKKSGKPGGAPAASAGVDSTNQYRKLHFVVEFKAKERAVVGVLNRLAKDPMFMVATGLELERTGVDTVGVAPVAEGAKDPNAAAPEAEQAAPPVREETFVSGPELDAPVRVRLDVDVYRFNEE